MHFSKTYSQLLQACLPELRKNAVDYRQVNASSAVLRFVTFFQLKKLINQLVVELESLGLGPTVLQDLLKSSEDKEESRVEKIIPLVSDLAFFELLFAALRRLCEQLSTVGIGCCMASFVDVPCVQGAIGFEVGWKGGGHRYAEQEGVCLLYKNASLSRNCVMLNGEIEFHRAFQLYVESEVFESVNELHPGERTIKETETGLTQFTEWVAARNFSDTHRLKLPQSHRALESFLQLNVFILNVKRFEFANAEAMRKILKKHVKQTALPATDLSNTSSLDLLPVNTSLPRILVQELDMTLLPIIPSLEDYTCLICTSIAFKPIRLSCGHLFCVQCLVKMQKRSNAQWPMCCAPCTVHSGHQLMCVVYSEFLFSESGHWGQAVNYRPCKLNVNVKET
ncbi:hypothetical protein K438DRAFT_2172324 [Mycena galopus ATCC 62051]|nr:hypothetical protein K438DRAFT_2172324 [Mycena galopus ATCC 62051]